jgi:hypothetical protein
MFSENCPLNTGTEILNAIPNDPQGQMALVSMMYAKAANVPELAQTIMRLRDTRAG